MNNLPQQYAWTHLEGEQAVSHRALQRGDTIYSFRGEAFTFEGVTRPAYGNSSGRVAASRPCPESHETATGGRECTHCWHRNGIEWDEFFPSVFGLYLGDEKGEEA